MYYHCETTVFTEGFLRFSYAIAIKVWVFQKILQEIHSKNLPCVIFTECFYTCIHFTGRCGRAHWALSFCVDLYCGSSPKPAPTTRSTTIPGATTADSSDWTMPFSTYLGHSFNKVKWKRYVLVRDYITLYNFFVFVLESNVKNRVGSVGPVSRYRDQFTEIP